MSPDELTLRELLWMNHGHVGVYGDDGEMQCAICGVDFKRDSVKSIALSFYLRALQELGPRNGDINGPQAT